jgi:hypothetical protein
MREEASHYIWYWQWPMFGSGHNVCRFLTLWLGGVGKNPGSTTFKGAADAVSRRVEGELAGCRVGNVRRQPDRHVDGTRVTERPATVAAVVVA